MTLFEPGKTYKVNVKSGRADGPGWETWMNCKVLEVERAIVKRVRTTNIEGGFLVELDNPDKRMIGAISSIISL